MDNSEYDSLSGIFYEWLNALVLNFFPFSIIGTQRFEEDNLNYDSLFITDREYVGSAAEILDLPYLFNIHSLKLEPPDIDTMYLLEGYDVLVKQVEMDTDYPLHCRLRKMMTNINDDQYQNFYYVNGRDIRQKRKYVGHSSTIVNDLNTEIEFCEHGYYVDAVDGISIRCPNAIIQNIKKRCELAEYSSMPALSEVMEDLQENGIYVVYKPHKNYPDPEYQFRFSFSFQEKELALSLNDMQKVAYRVLKGLVRTEINHKTTSEKKLQSYLLKTTLFWVCEELPKGFCEAKNIGKFFFALVDKLLHFLSEGHLPHYFIPQGNLLDGYGEDIIHVWMRGIHRIRLYTLNAMLNFYQVYEVPDAGSKRGVKTLSTIVATFQLAWMLAWMFGRKSLGKNDLICFAVGDFCVSIFGENNLICSSKRDVRVSSKRDFRVSCYLRDTNVNLRNLICSPICDTRAQFECFMHHMKLLHIEAYNVFDLMRLHFFVKPSICHCGKRLTLELEEGCRKCLMAEFCEETEKKPELYRKLLPEIANMWYVRSLLHTENSTLYERKAIGLFEEAIRSQEGESDKPLNQIHFTVHYSMYLIAKGSYEEAISVIVKLGIPDIQHIFYLTSFLTEMMDSVLQIKMSGNPCISFLTRALIYHLLCSCYIRAGVYAEIMWPSLYSKSCAVSSFYEVHVAKDSKYRVADQLFLKQDYFGALQWYHKQYGRSVIACVANLFNAENWRNSVERLRSMGSQTNQTLAKSPISEIIEPVKCIIDSLPPAHEQGPRKCRCCVVQ